MNPAEAFVISLLAKATVIFVAGATIGFFLRNRSASTQRAVWALTLAASLGLPLGIALTPAWRVAVIPTDEIAALVKPIRPATTESAPTTVSAAPTIDPVIASQPQTPSVITNSTGSGLPSVPVILAIVWMAGVVLVLARMGIGLIGLHRVVRRSARLADDDWQRLLRNEAKLAGVERPVQLLSTGDVSTPLTFGFRSPKIILPEESSEWTQEHRAVVIRHEMAHIASADAGACLIAGFAGAVYWFHPMVWIAAARLRRAQERACDDRVLTLGVAPADYAGHLLEVARSAREIGMPGFVSVAMARPSQLEGRLLAVLNDSNDRRTLTTQSKVGGIGAAFAGLILLSAFSPVKSASADVETTSSSAIVDEPVVTQPASLVQSSVVPFTSIPTTASRTKNVSADSVIEKTLTVQPGGTLVLDLETGAGLTIYGSKDSRIHMRASLGGSDWRSTSVELIPDGRGARLTMRYRGDERNRSSSHHIDLQIPHEYNLRLKSSGGGLHLTDVSGEFSGSTGGGDIRIERASGSAHLSTGGGDVKVSSSDLNGSVSTGGGAVVIESTSGDLRGGSGSGNVLYGRNGLTFSSGSASEGVRGSDGKTYVSKAGGSVNLGSLGGGASISTGGGGISIASANGDVSATTGGGDIRVGSVSGSTDLSTGAGDVSVRTTGSSAGRVKVSSGNGTVTITVPADLSAYLDLESGYTEEHGRTRIRSDFDIPTTETSDWDSTQGTPRRYVKSRASVGRGASGGTIRVRTTNGDIIIRKER